MSKKRVGFFGGCFNPPTNTHIKLANELVEHGVIDNVFFVPVGDYYKKDNLAPAIHRYNMLKIACKKYKNMGIEDIVLNQKESLCAIDTFKLIAEKYKDKAELYFIMGSDNYEKMPTWKGYEELITKYKIIVIERIKHEKIDIKDNIIMYRTEQKEDIASSNIRNMLKEKQDVSKYLDKDVIKYINDNSIYSLD